jgi:GNAT superfamily N-acetyltransferase
MTIALVSIDSDHWVRWRDMRLAALEEAPDAFCSSLSEWRNRGEHAWRDRLQGVALNLIAELDERDAGMVSAVDSQGEVELISMWVAPFARGRGVGDALVDEVVKWATKHDAPRLILRVVTGNDRAGALYARHGFTFEQTTLGENANSPGERLMARQTSD